MQGFSRDKPLDNQRCDCRPSPTSTVSPRSEDIRTGRTMRDSRTPGVSDVAVNPSCSSAEHSDRRPAHAAPDDHMHRGGHQVHGVCQRQRCADPGRRTAQVQLHGIAVPATQQESWDVTRCAISRGPRNLGGTGQLPQWPRLVAMSVRIPQMLTTAPRQGRRSRCGARTTLSTAWSAVAGPSAISRASAATTTGVAKDVPLQRAQPR